MLKRNVIYICVFLIFWISALYSGEKILYYISYILLFVPAISLALLILTMFRYKCFEKLDRRETFRGERVKYELKVYNEDIFLYPYIKAIFHADNFVTRTIFSDETFYLSPGKSYRIEKDVSCQHIGRYMIGVKLFEFVDFFRFFRLRSYYDRDNKQLLVLPRIVQLDKFKVLNTSYIESFQTGNQTGMEDYSEITEIKKYIPGLPLKNVHWKLSAKKNELMTKKFSSPHNRNISLYVDVHYEGLKNEKFLFVRDIIIETTLAVLKFCLSKTIPVKVYFNDPNLTRVSFANQYDFDIIYSKLFNMNFESTISLGNMLMINREQYGEITRDIILITANLNEDLYDHLVHFKLSGKDITFIYASPDDLETILFSRQFMNGLHENKINTYIIKHADEIKKVLESG